MLLALAVFILVVGAIVGAYYAATSLPGMLAARRLNQRLQDVAAVPGGPAATGDATVVKTATAGPLPEIDRLIAKSSAGSGLAKLIERSGVPTTPSAIVLMSVLCALVSGLLTRMLLAPVFAAPVVAVLASALPTLFLVHRKGKRLKRFEEQFPEALDLLSRAIRAGHAFQTAMGMVADELPEPVGPEFKKTFDQQNYGLPLRDALNELSQRLEGLAHVVRERFKIQRDVRTHTSHGRFTGYVLMALPAALAVALSFINPEHMQLLFRERMGQMMMMGAVVMQGIGYIWIRKVIKIEV
jgi:tight adherence protein B